ncbi:unnamed protein product, partial [Allacma fusca]
MEPSTEDISDLLEWKPPEKFKQQYPSYLSGYDYDNRAVIVILTGKWDTQKIAEEEGQDLKDFLRRNHQFIERIKNGYYRRRVNESERGSNDDEIVIIMDYDGFDFRQVQSQKNTMLAMKFLEQLESCYDKFAYGFIVNANSLVDQMLSLGKPLMGQFIERMEIHGTNPRKFIPQILKKIPRSQLNATYGG